KERRRSWYTFVLPLTELSVAKETVLGEEEAEDAFTLYVKNLNFETTEEALKKHFTQVGKVRSVTIAKKKDLKASGKLVSLGYGFVEFFEKESLTKAMKSLQVFS